MKTKNVSILLATILLIGVVLSCKKFLSDQVPIATEIQKDAGIGLGEVITSNNPYDYIGERHNRALQAADDYVQKTGKTDEEGKRAAIVAYYKKAVGKDVMPILAKTSKELERFRETAYQDFLEHYKTSHICREYLQRLKDDTDRLDSYEQQSNYQENVRRLEVEVLADKNLSDQERKVLLVTTAVAKYSSQFWVEKIRFTQQHEGEKRSFLHRLMRLHAYITTDMFAATYAVVTFDADIVAADESAAMAWYVDNFL